MKKTISKILLGGLLGASALTFNGCQGLATAIYQDTPFGEIDMARQRARAPQVNVYENQGGNDSWQGTPIVNQYNTPDGDMVFIIDANKVGREVQWSEIDNYVDTTKYIRLEGKNISEGKARIIYIKR
ncbi:MAG: hypothetical protein WC584_01940 [Candidatus Pacearchaeota archaeon]